MFHKASVKLATLYLTIMMLISVFFSANIYQLSMQELDRGLRRPVLQDRALGILPGNVRDALQDLREKQYEEAATRVLERLAIVNLVILVGGGFLSYYLALRTLKPIEKAHESQSRFTADASHELRTPIAAMQTEIEVTLMNPKLTLFQAQQQLKSNLEELARLTNLSEGLLELAQMEHSDFQREVVDIDKIVQAAITAVSNKAEAKSILMKSPQTSDAKVYADSASLTQALVVILDNAIKYSSKKTEIVVTYRKDHRNIVLKVRDHGMGIKTTELEHIFDRFYRADAARSSQNTNGYGLGLAIAKSIVELHDGTITAKSKVGQGSTFIISLPRA